MKAAVYLGTRNVYDDMLTSLKSLLVNSDVERIYLMIEDDYFPVWLPAYCEVINVSGQPYFSKNGPNYYSHWTYMILLKTVVTKYIPDLDRILLLDTDTIVIDDISAIWDIDLDGYYFAAAKEPSHSTDQLTYINAGVMLLNLQLLRERKKDDELVEALNERWYSFKEQTCFNQFCQGRIKELSSEYNVCDYTEPAARPRILHFAARNDWRNRPEVRRFRDLPMDQIRKGKA